VEFVGMLRTLSLGPEDVEQLSVAYEDALRALQLSSRTDPITTIIARSSKPPKPAYGTRRNSAHWQSRISGFRKDPGNGCALLPLARTSPSL
jgi:hypothetical protein